MAGKRYAWIFFALELLLGAATIYWVYAVTEAGTRLWGAYFVFALTIAYTIAALIDFAASCQTKVFQMGGAEVPPASDCHERRGLILSSRSGAAPRGTSQLQPAPPPKRRESVEGATTPRCPPPPKVFPRTQLKYCRARAAR